MQEKFSLINKTKSKTPVLPFLIMKNDILGKSYSLSLAIVGEKKSREINKRYRDKDKPTNVLSFALSKKEGEIIVCPAVVRRECKNFNKTFDQFFGFLVIHGMLHLKGMEHSSKMERAEDKYDQKYFYRNRYGDIHDQSRGGRIHQGRRKS